MIKNDAADIEYLQLFPRLRLAPNIAANTCLSCRLYPFRETTGRTAMPETRLIAIENTIIQALLQNLVVGQISQYGQQHGQCRQSLQAIENGKPFGLLVAQNYCADKEMRKVLAYCLIGEVKVLWR